MGVNQTVKDPGLSINLESNTPQVEGVSIVDQITCNSVEVNIKSQDIRSCKCDRGQHLNWEPQDLGQKEWLGISKTEFARLELAAIESKCLELIQSAKSAYWLHTPVTLTI